MVTESINIKDRLFSKILLLFLILFVIPVLGIGIGASSMYLNILTDKATTSYAATLNNLENILEDKLFETKMSAYYMYLDLDLKEAISTYTLDRDQSLEAEKIVRDKFDNYKISPSFSNVNAVKVYGFNGFMMSFGESYHLNNLDDSMVLNNRWYERALSNPDEFIWTGVQDGFNLEGGSPSISLFRVIKDRSYSKTIAMLYVNLDTQIFTTLADSFSFSENSQIYILDNNNKTVSGQDAPNLILEYIDKNRKDFERNYSTVIEGPGQQKFFLNYLAKYDWKVIGVLPMAEVTSSTTEVFYYLVMAFLLVIVLASVVWLLALSRLFTPVRKLTSAIELVRGGDFSVQVDHSGKDELGMLTNNFNFMVHKISDLMMEVVDENSRKKDAEYRALQAQINPHFLYNTLNSIRWMAIIQKVDNIKNVVDVLGRLLRNSTRNVGQYITVEEELSNLEDYVYIQKIAYNNKFQVEYDVDEESKHCSCLKFILQPLVENAIFHGILPKESFGNIWVKVKLRNNTLYIRVEDDGVGMNLKSQESGSSGSYNKLNSIGLGGLRERLEMAYAGAAGFSIESEANSFTRIVIKMPLNGQISESSELKEQDNCLKS